MNFPSSIEIVWDSITVIDKMKKWYFEQIEYFEPTVGFETRFDVISGERTFPHCWKITEVNIPYRITYNWKFDGYEGASSVTFELKSVATGTNLKVINIVLEDFPDDVPEFTRDNCFGGWYYFLDRLLKYLKNQ
jgi:uncharacterized protein YndB with AHSA1/START domain